MKLTIDLDDLYAEEWAGSLKSIIHGEIERLARQMVQDALKAQFDSAKQRLDDSVRGRIADAVKLVSAEIDAMEDEDLLRWVL